MTGWAARVPIFIAATLLTGGVLSLAMGERDTSSARLAGTDAPVDVGAATDPLGTVATNSPTVVADPLDPANLVVVSRVDLPRFGCALHTSQDGGARWTPGTLRDPPGEHAVGCFGPDATFGPDGVLYVSSTSASVPAPGRPAATDAIWVTRSRDKGRSFAPPVAIATSMALQVRIAADPVVSGRVYLSWLQAADTQQWGLVGSGTIMVARSDDGGVTWAAPVVVNPTRRSLVAAPTIIATGQQVLVAYLDVGDDRLDYTGAHEGKGGPAHDGSWSVVAAWSTDHGRSWSESTVDEHLTPIQRFVQLFAPTPSLAVDESGSRAYVAFPTGERGDGDVVVWASADAGHTWGSGRPITGPRPKPGAQYSPALAVGPDGRVDVVYYDRHADPENAMNDVSFQSSTDHGHTFGPRLRLNSASFDSRVGFGADRDLPEMGSRLGLLAAGDATLAVWSDSRSGNPSLIRQDLARAIVTFPTAPRWRRPLFAGGSAAILGAIAVLLVAWSVRTRSGVVGAP